MEINAVSSMSNGGNYTQSTVAEVAEVAPLPQLQLLKDKMISNTPENQGDKQELTSDEAQTVSREMNKFMQLLNSSIRFVLHEKTNTLIVQVVDSKDNTVLKEFPPHELLDTKAKIREYVGILLDRHV